MSKNNYEMVDLLLRMMSGEENVIQKKEKEGQDELIRRTMLPRTMYPEKSVWEELGFSFSDIPTDDLMYEGTLPDGWNIQGTQHHMWSEIIDKDRNIRGNIFYKASPYDRKAYMALDQKYRIEKETNTSPDSIKYSFYFGNDEEKLYSSREIEIRDEDYIEKPELYQMMIESLEEEVKNFADTNYPDWNSVKNYWSKEKSNVKVKK